MYLITDFGWEYFIKTAFTDEIQQATSFTFGYYDDLSDDIQPGDDLGSITTEPNGSAYARQTVPASDMISAFSTGRWQGTVPPTDFDVSDSTNTIRSVFAGTQFESSRAGDTSPTDHLIMTGALGDEVDLSNYSNIYTLEGFGIYDAGN